MSGKFQIKLWLVVLLVILLPTLVRAYSDKITHPALAEVSVGVYGENFSSDLTIEQGGWVIQGSIDEDSSLRMANHFYDPVHIVGWNFNYSSINWASGDMFDNIYSWPKALEYYAKGDEKMAFLSLGHLLHLLEDMTVPDHTRNDTHLPPKGSIYESWIADSYSRSEVKEKFVQFNNLGNWKYDNFSAYLINLAQYSNGNYFSKNTILDKNFTFPKITNIDNNYYYSSDSFYGDFHKVLLKYQLADQSGVINKEKAVGLIDPDKKNSSVLSDYFDRLGTQAVIAGANAINLFMVQAEKARADYLEKQRQDGLDKKTQRENLKQTQNFATGGLLAAALSSDVAQNTFDSIGSGFSSATDAIFNSTSFGLSWFGHKIVAAGSLVYYGASTGLNTTINLYNLTVKTSSLLSTNSPASVVSSLSISNNSEPVISNSNLNSSDDITKNESFIENSIAKQEVVKTSSVSLSDAQVANIIAIIKNYLLSSTTDNSSKILQIQDINLGTNAGSVGGGAGGNFTKPLNLSSSNQSSSTSTDITATSTELENSTSTIPQLYAPSLELTQNPCDKTVAVGACLLLKPTVEIGWLSTSSDYAVYTLNINGENSTTTATSTTFELSASTPTYFSVSLIDATTTLFTKYSLNLEYNPSPVIINEIYWDGYPNPYDQWLEIYNKTDKIINLNNWSIVNASSTMRINLTGVINSKSYYVTERKVDEEVDLSTDSPIIGLTPDNWSDWGEGISSDGEQLVLQLENQDAVSDIVPYCDGWCGLAGNNMERITTESVINLEEGWTDQYYDMMISKVLHDKAGYEIWGTPGRRNASTYKIANPIIGGRLVLDANSTYFTDDDIEILEEGELVLQSGTVLKLPQKSIIRVEGKISSMADDNNPAIVTSLYDSDSGWDLSTGSDLPSMSYGYLDKIVFLSTSVESVINNITFRYFDEGLIFGAGDFNLKNIKIDHFGLNSFYSNGITMKTQTNIIAENLTIMDSNVWDGITMTGSSSLKIKNFNYIDYGNLAKAGIELYDGARLEVDGWSQEGGQYGLYVFKNSYAKLTGVSVKRGNNTNFLCTAKDSVVDIIKAKIFSGQSWGDIDVSDRSTVNIEDLELQGTDGDWPITIQNGANFNLKNSTILG
ncbi:MAG: hypothetical protein WCO30_00090, partial [bacterium]